MISNVSSSIVLPLLYHLLFPPTATGNAGYQAVALCLVHTFISLNREEGFTTSRTVHDLLLFYHQFVIHHLAARTAADTVRHMLAIGVATSVHNQTHFRADGVVPRAVAINHPYSSIQALDEFGAMPLGGPG